MSHVNLPRPFAAFRSIASPLGPFDHLRQFLERQVGRPLNFDAFALAPGDWQDFRYQTWRWLHMRGEAEKLESLLRPGRTAPLISKTCRPFSAELRAPGDLAWVPVRHEEKTLYP